MSHTKKDNNKMHNVRAFHSSGHNILLTDENNELFILGDNAAGKTGIKQNLHTLNVPTKMNIQLNNKEEVMAFRSYPQNLMIYTNQQRLIIPSTNNNGNYTENALGLVSANSNRNRRNDSDDESESDSEYEHVRENTSTNTLSTKDRQSIISRMREPFQFKIFEKPFKAKSKESKKRGSKLQELSDDESDVYRDIKTDIKTESDYDEEVIEVSESESEDEEPDPDSQLNNFLEECKLDRILKTAIVNQQKSQLEDSSKPPIAEQSVSTTADLKPSVIPEQSVTVIDTTTIQQSFDLHQQLYPGVDRKYIKIAKDMFNQCITDNNHEQLKLLDVKLREMVQREHNAVMCYYMRRQQKFSDQSAMTIMQNVNEESEDLIKFITSEIDPAAKLEIQHIEAMFEAEVHLESLRQIVDNIEKNTVKEIPKQKAAKREPSKYQKYIGAELKRQRRLHPNLKSHEYMRLAVYEWQKKKGNKSDNKEENSKKPAKKHNEKISNSVKITSLINSINYKLDEWNINNTHGITIHEKVTGIVWGHHSVIYEIDGKLILETISTFVPNRSMSPHARYCARTYHTSLPLRDYGSNKACREICLSFNRDETRFMSHFIYIRSGEFHHVLMPTLSLCGAMTYFVFKSDFAIKPEDIHCSKTGTLYIVNEGAVYQYVPRTQQLELLIAPCSEGIRIMFADQIYGEELVVLDNKRVHLGSNTGIMDYGKNICAVGKILGACCLYHKPNDAKATLLIIYKDDASKDESVIKTAYSGNFLIFVNVHDSKCCNIMNMTCFSVVHEKEMRIIFANSDHTPQHLDHHVFSPSSISYASSDIPVMATDAQHIILNGCILIRTEDAIYYAFINNHFAFQKLNLNGTIQTESKPDLIVKSDLIKYLVPPRHNITANIQTGDAHLPKFLVLTELNNPYNQLRVSYSLYNDSISSGDGVSRNFIEYSLREFAETYFVQHNSVSSLNLDVVSQKQKCTDAALFVMGKALAFAINNISMHLPIRIPLLIVSAILRRHPTIPELEYFANKEDDVAFTQLSKIKADPEALIQAGFAGGYSSALRHICKFTPYDATMVDKAYVIARKIADGFMSSTGIINYTQMNVATLDEYLSGPYTLDVEKFISNIQFSSNDKVKTYSKRITDIIRSMQQQELKNMLVNMSGSSVISGSYSISIETYKTKKSKTSAVFGTCGRSMSLNNTLFEECTDEFIKQVLCSPCILLRG